MFESLIQWVRVVYAEELEKKLSPYANDEVSELNNVSIGKSLLSLDKPTKAESPSRKFVEYGKIDGVYPSVDLRLRSDNFKPKKISGN